MSLNVLPDRRLRILIAWELGENYGHVLSLLPIATQLQARGHSVLVVAADVSLVGPLLQAAGVALVQAPLPPKPNLQREIASFADILAAHGFGDCDALSALVGGWQHIYDQFRPDAVVVNHAPAALFAARLARIPTAAIGTGFELPPPRSPYPCFRPWLNLPESALLEAEALILVNLRRVCIAHNQPAPAVLSEMRADAQFLLTFAETDHYPDRGDATYSGPVGLQDHGLDAAWRDGARRKLFVYLWRSDQLAAILDRLRECDAQVICVIPDIDPVLAATYRSCNFQVFRTAVKLAPLLSGCDLAITHGGHGTLSTFLLAGIPLLLIPTQLEQMLLSQRIQRAGFGLALSLGEVTGHFDEALKRMLAGAEFAIRARNFAASHADFDQVRNVERITSAIEELLTPEA